MNAYPDSPFNSLVRWIDAADGAGVIECVPTYETIVDALNKTSWDDLASPIYITRAQAYLQCTQLGGLRVTTEFDLDILPFGAITEEYQYRFCEDIFGEGYNRHALVRAVQALNENFGGQDQVITNVAFSNAALDPNLHHGIADYDLYESVVVFLESMLIQTYFFIFISNYLHIFSDYSAGTDLRSMSDMDSVNLLTSKRTIESYVRRWATGSY